MSKSFNDLVLDIAQKSILEPEYWQKYLVEKDIQGVRAHNVHRPLVDGLFSPVAQSEEEETLNKDIYSNVNLMFEVLSNCHQNVPGWKAIPFETFVTIVNVTPITGGLTNLIHCVSIAEAHDLSKDSAETLFAAEGPLSPSMRTLLTDLKTQLGDQYETISSICKLNIKWPDHKKVAVRIYGTNAFANRELELNIVKLASSWGVSEQLFYCWPRGRITSFLEGASLSPQQWCDKDTAKDAVLLLGQLHAMPLPDSIKDTSLTINKYLQRWFNLADRTALVRDARAFVAEHSDAVSMFDALAEREYAPTEFPEPPAAIARYLAPLLAADSYPNALVQEPEGFPRPSHEELLRLMAYLDIEGLQREVEWLIYTMKESKLPITFCHNDFHGGNVIYQPGEPQPNCATNGKTLAPSNYRVIDFEYGGLNYRGFDFANSLCETSIIYTGPYPGFVMNCPKAMTGVLYPTPNKAEPTVDDYSFTDFEEHFVQTYKRGYQQLLEQLSESEMTQDAVNSHGLLVEGINKDKNPSVSSLLVEASLMQLASHLQWAIWSVILADEGTITTFGYLEYACVRMLIYLKKKKLLQDMGIIKF